VNGKGGGGQRWTNEDGGDRQKLKKERMTLIPLRHGAALNVEIQSGAADAPVLVLLHGFTGSSRTWSGLRSRVGEDLTLVAIDAMGHGKSAVPNDPNRYTMANGIADIVDILDKLNIGHCFLLGYSMGGRMALHMALNAPHRIQGLILESATAGIRNEEERQARLRADEKWATLLEKEGITAFVNHWEQLPLFTSQKVNLSPEGWQGQRERRLGNSTKGLAASLRGAGTAAQDNLWGRLHTLAMPTLLIAGELDQKFSGLAREMQPLIPRSELTIVPGVGHATHLEAPDTFVTLVKEFVSKVVGVRPVANL
jgi:2-succinyl-6-hydroxy-2,4-cyclohexadiene-1-carboxylate synthase